MPKAIDDSLFSRRSAGTRMRYALRDVHRVLGVQRLRTNIHVAIAMGIEEASG